MAPTATKRKPAAKASATRKRTTRAKRSTTSRPAAAIDATAKLSEEVLENH